MFHEILPHQLRHKFESYDILFWDFDGVIKDSVFIKSSCFERLFLPCSIDTLEKIRSHHIVNGGVSRFEKIPLYLEFSGLPFSSNSVNSYLNYFSSLCVDSVLQSAWVPGVEDFIQTLKPSIVNILVTATPTDEITNILTRLGLLYFFDHIYGSPIDKSRILARCLSMFPDKSSLFIGDSFSDYKAAKSVDIDFLLRSTAYNSSLLEYANHFSSFPHG